MHAHAQRLSCLASNHAWRRQAANLRRHAELTLPADACATLRREAEAADRQADIWLDGAIEAR